MSPEERQLLTDLFDRTRDAGAQPRDRDAEMLISEAVRAQPYAPYLLAQTVLVQEQALRAAAEKIEQLETQARMPAPPAPGGFLGALFGGGAAQPRSAPQGGAPQPASQTASQAAPNAAPQRGPWGQPQQAPGPWGGAPQAAPGGFLKGALGTAAGVAGGVLLANSLSSLFHGAGAGGLGIGSGHKTEPAADTAAQTSNADAPQNAAWDQSGDDGYVSDADFTDDGFVGGGDDGLDI